MRAAQCQIHRCQRTEPPSAHVVPRPRLWHFGMRRSSEGCTAAGPGREPFVSHPWLCSRLCCSASAGTEAPVAVRSASSPPLQCPWGCSSGAVAPPATVLRWSQTKHVRGRRGLLMGRVTSLGHGLRRSHCPAPGPWAHRALHRPAGGKVGLGLVSGCLWDLTQRTQPLWVCLSI